MMLIGAKYKRYRNTIMIKVTEMFFRLQTVEGFLASVFYWNLISWKKYRSYSWKPSF